MPIVFLIQKEYMKMHTLNTPENVLQFVIEAFKNACDCSHDIDDIISAKFEGMEKGHGLLIFDVVYLDDENQNDYATFYAEFDSEKEVWVGDFR
jgi:hypothetical protein